MPRRRVVLAAFNWRTALFLRASANAHGSIHHGQLTSIIYRCGNVKISLSVGSSCEVESSGSAEHLMQVNRQPVFLGIREDKDANEVVREEAS